MELEERVWDLVSGLLKDPERLRAGLDEIIETERAGMRGDPESEVLAWLGRITALESKRSRYQDMAAEGHIASRSWTRSCGSLRDSAGPPSAELADLEPCGVLAWRTWSATRRRC